MCAPADAARPALHAALRRPPCARASCISYLSRPCLRPASGRPPGLWRLHWRRRRSQRPPGRSPRLRRRACPHPATTPIPRDDDDHGRDSGRVRDDGHDDNNGNRHNRGDAAPGVDDSTCGDDCAVVGRERRRARAPRPSVPATTARRPAPRAATAPKRASGSVGDASETAARPTTARRRSRAVGTCSPCSRGVVQRHVGRRARRRRVAPRRRHLRAARLARRRRRGRRPVLRRLERASAAGGCGSATGPATSSTTRTSRGSRRSPSTERAFARGR